VTSAASTVANAPVRGLSATDHKRLALNVGVVAFMFFIAGGGSR
jgi:hypothetical protein